MALCFCLLATGGAAFWGCTPKETSKIAVAKVNGRVVSLEEFKAQAAFTGLSPDPASLTPGLRFALLESLTRRALILEVAGERDISLSKEEYRQAEARMRQGLSAKEFERILSHQDIDIKVWRSVLAKELLKRKVLDLVLITKVRVTPEQVRAYYEKHKNVFHRPSQILAQHAVLPNRGMALALLNRVNKGEDMGLAAASLGAPLAEAGQPTWLSRGHMPPALEKKIFALNPGKLAGPYKSTYGFHVVRVLEKRDARMLTLAQAAGEIHRDLMAAAKEKVAVAWAAKLRKKAKIWIHERFVKTGRID